jgi:hypothetical protein
VRGTLDPDLAGVVAALSIAAHAWLARAARSPIDRRVLA